MGKTIEVIAAHEYSEVRDICQKIKTDRLTQVKCALEMRDIALHDERLAYQYIHFVPVPQHGSGAAEYTAELTHDISPNGGQPLVSGAAAWDTDNYLIRERSALSNYERKKRGKPTVHKYWLNPQFDRLYSHCRDLWTVCLVDNVCATGETITECAKLFPDHKVMALVYAVDKKSVRYDNLKITIA